MAAVIDQRLRDLLLVFELFEPGLDQACHGCAGAAVPNGEHAAIVTITDLRALRILRALRGVVRLKADTTK